jgi:SAM-dependent methyltransferase
VSFEVAAEAYDRFMGRFSRLIAPRMADVAGIRPGQAALDVGCGTGMLTRVLVERLGADHVTGIDPSESFVAAARERFPGVREMARVTRPGGVVAACVWDHAGGSGPVSLFWRAALDVLSDVTDEGVLPGTRAGHLVEIFETAGLDAVEGLTLRADLEMATFDAYWEPFNRGVGPAGVFLGKLDAEPRARVEARARELAGPEPFVIPATAWVARGVAQTPEADKVIVPVEG